MENVALRTGVASKLYHQVSKEIMQGVEQEQGASAGPSRSTPGGVGSRNASTNVHDKPQTNVHDRL